MGCVGLGDRWKEIPQAAAKKILAFVLTKDLAYSSKIMPIAEAEKFSTKMLKFFPSPCKFFTNAVFTNNLQICNAEPRRCIFVVWFWAMDKAVGI